MTILHWIGDAIRDQLLRVPLWAARWLFLGLLLGMMGWVVQLPPRRRHRPAAVANGTKTCGSGPGWR